MVQYMCCKLYYYSYCIPLEAGTLEACWSVLEGRMQAALGDIPRNRGRMFLCTENVGWKDQPLLNVNLWCSRFSICEWWSHGRTLERCAELHQQAIYYNFICLHSEANSFT